MNHVFGNAKQKNDSKKSHFWAAIAGSEVVGRRAIVAKIGVEGGFNATGKYEALHDVCGINKSDADDICRLASLATEKH